MDKKRLPGGWITLPFSEVITKISTNKIKVKQKEYLPSGKLPVIDQGQEYIGGYTDDESKRVKCELPVLVFGDHTKAVKLVKQEFAPGADGVKILKSLPFFEPRLFSFFVTVLAKKIPDKGYARHFQYLEKSRIPLPPLPEQPRIVAKIEELFSDLDNGIASLKKAQAQLKIYRQAVLKYAFEGKLTAEWRESRAKAQRRKEEKTEENLSGSAAPREDAKALLEHIKHERERHYTQQLDDWKHAVKAWEANGKPGKKPTKPKKPKELPPLTEAELAELTGLPEGWCWVKIGNLTVRVEYGTSSKSLKQGKVPVLRMGNIQNGIFDWSNLVYTSDDEEIRRYLLKKDDVLFNRTNSPELVGKTAIYRGERKAIFAGYLIRINQIPELVNAKYLSHFLNSIVAKNHGNKVKTDGVNQSNINGEKLKNYPFPYTSLLEQNQIVAEIESRLSVCDKLEQTIEESLHKAEALRQSILKRAFEGKLVPQDPNDEPAQKLLERIHAERGGGHRMKKPQQLRLENI